MALYLFATPNDASDGAEGVEGDPEVAVFEGPEVADWCEFCRGLFSEVKRRIPKGSRLSYFNEPDAINPRMVFEQLLAEHGYHRLDLPRFELFWQIDLGKSENSYLINYVTNRGSDQRNVIQLDADK